MRNYRRGFFRFWLVFTVCWAGYFLWQGVRTYPHIDGFQQLGNQALTMAREAETNTIYAGPGFPKDFRETEAARHRERAMEIFRYRDDARDRFEQAYTYGPLVPVGLIVAYWIGVFILRGFDSDLSKSSHQPAPRDLRASNGGRTEVPPLAQKEYEGDGNSGEFAVEITKTTKRGGRLKRIFIWTSAVTVVFLVSLSMNEHRAYETLISTLTQGALIGLIYWVVVKFRPWRAKRQQAKQDEIAAWRKDHP